MRRLIDRLLARWYVRRSLLDASIENTNMALRLIDEWKQMRPVVHGCELPLADTPALQRIFNACNSRMLDALSRTLHPPVIITTDYRRDTPCS